MCFVLAYYLGIIIGQKINSGSAKKHNGGNWQNPPVLNDFYNSSISVQLVII